MAGTLKTIAARLNQDVLRDSLDDAIAAKDKAYADLTKAMKAARDAGMTEKDHWYLSRSSA